MALLKSPPEKQTQKTGITTLQTRLNQAHILQRRKEGMSFPDIADELGMTQGYIYKAYKRALRDIIVEDVEDLRKLEMAKLDALEQEVLKLLASFHPLVSGGQVVRDVVDDERGSPRIDPETGKVITARLQDNSSKLAAVDRAVKLMERRARLLGLDAPTKVAPTTPEGDKPWYVGIQASPQDETL